MITELERHDLHKIDHLIPSCPNIEARAVMRGTNPGAVYADCPDHPAAALIWIEGQQGFQLVEDPRSLTFREGLENYMDTHIEPRLKKRHLESVEIGAETGVWDQALTSIFHRRDLSTDTQHVFGWKTYSHTLPLQDTPFTVRSIDAELLRPGTLRNLAFLEQKIRSFWDSTDSFLRQGLGYAAERDGQTVSVCLSAFVADGTHAADLETLEPYRRSGFGAVVAGHFVQTCLQKSIRPYWDCSPDNTGSIRIARLSGLAPLFDYRIFLYGLS